MRIPKHIGIIPDGNRRWATSNGMSKKDGYDYGLDPGVKLLRKAIEYGVEEVTYYGFTVDNCKRPTEQIMAFQKACVDAIDIISQEKASLLVVGNTESKFFPKELLKYTDGRVSMPEKKKENSTIVKVNFLVNYGWKWDIENGLKSKDISRMDMVIRWGGMRRLSGFLPVQSVYADFYIVDDYWPDYRDEQFDKAIEWYQSQDVTLGG